MNSWVNGVPADSVGLDNRAFNFGDGVFETLLVLNGKPMWAERHWQRLSKACARLYLELNIGLLEQEVSAFLAASHSDLTETGFAFCRLKVIVCRVKGEAKGYGFAQNSGERNSLEANSLGLSGSDRVLQLFPAASPVNTQWESGTAVEIAAHQLSSNKQLCGIKHLNRLDQVLASQGLIAGNERLVLDQEGNVVEGVASNVFLYSNGRWFTPILDNAGVQGIVRDWALEQDSNISLRTVTVEQVRSAEAVFLTNSIRGIWPVASFNGQKKSLQEGVPLRFIRQLQKQFLQELGLSA